MKHSSMNIVSAQRQRGVVLIIGLVLLMALTIVGVASMSNNTLQSRMAGNLADSNLAFNAAETAARAYENALNPNITPVPNCQGATFDKTTKSACVLADASEDPVRRDANWMQTQNHSWWTSAVNGTGFNFVNTYTGKYTEQVAGNNIISTAPRVIGELQSVTVGLRLDPRNLQSGSSAYRITARATGASNNSQAIIQEIVTLNK